MAFVRCLPLLVVFVALMGCGEGSTSVAPTNTAPADAIKASLQTAAETGTVGSEMMTVQENIDLLKATDAAKADALAKDLQELQSLTDPAKVKAKAKEMMGKL